MSSVFYRDLPWDHDPAVTPDNFSELTEAQYNKLKDYVKDLVCCIYLMRKSLYKETVTVDGLMDVNGSNAENGNNHFAKNQVFYGRKDGVRDVMLGVKQGDKSHEDTPEVDISPTVQLHADGGEKPNYITQTDSLPAGLDNLIRKYCLGQIQLHFSVDPDLFQEGYKPEVSTGTFYMTPGNLFLFPTVEDIDGNNGNAPHGTPGTSDYYELRLKPGFKVVGWKVFSINTSTTTLAPVLYDDNGEKLQTPQSDGHGGITHVDTPDNRVFYTVLHNSELNLSPSTPDKKVVPAKLRIPFFKELFTKTGPNISLQTMHYKFNLEVKADWYDIEFVVLTKDWNVAPNSPVKQKIRTSYHQTIVLPIPNLITPKPEATHTIFTDSTHPNGIWTTAAYNPDTAQFIGLPTDPYGGTIDCLEFSPGDELVVGEDIPSGVRTLYLMYDPWGSNPRP